MKFKKIRYPITTITGIFLILIFFIFIFFSILFYNKNWSPFNTRLSDFGSISTGNTIEGALLFNIGIIIVGCMLIPFYIGLYRWLNGLKEKKKRKLLITTLLFGCLSGISLIMLGIFPVETDPIHEIWAGSFFLFNQFVLILIGISLLNHEKFIKSISIYGWIVASINLFYIITQEPILEWFTIYTALGLVGLLAFNTYKFSKIK
ncbi:MAG: DUF998 domain-containing protein [Candidatus Lokiarchaeota archaeon]|nr:DUF998 domain-containing protein [Candidatus Lokiarchaeota archaeon]